MKKIGKWKERERSGYSNKNKDERWEWKLERIGDKLAEYEKW